ncbi:hypothetical protein [Rhizobium sullae]|uniref:Uncharacterized protein n=1 Tax=Rhizobium sullae TaxID=50338 RepID=A0A4R3PUC2_RHISU|nr:hypothetical protein [Rhizobium sullae]TCU11218.1 hypothetical protein EV132_11888 [Rhizobium sullae]
MDQSQFDTSRGRAKAIPTGVAIPNRRKKATDATPQLHQKIRNLPVVSPVAQRAKVSKKKVKPTANPLIPNTIRT